MKKGDFLWTLILGVIVYFIVLKTILLFWIPAHTISFLMPENMRVMLAALLSIAFGVIVAYYKLIKSNAKVVLSK